MSESRPLPHMTGWDRFFAVLWLVLAAANLLVGGDAAITMGCIVASIVFIRTARR